MKYVRIFTLATIATVIIFTNVVNFSVYKNLNAYTYDSMYIFNNLRNIIAIDYQTNSLDIFHTNQTLSASHKLEIEDTKDLRVKYISSKNYIFMYIYNEKFESLYSIKRNETFDTKKIFSSKEILNSDPQYLNFNDYIFFYNNAGKISSVRIKNNQETFINYDIDYENVNVPDDYGYYFNVGDKSYCFDNSKYANGCYESLYNDVDYRGKYIINNNDRVALYNKYNKSYLETLFNTTEYEYYTNVFIDKDNRLFFLAGEKNINLQMVPYIMMVNPTEEYKVSFEELNTSYTKSKVSLIDTLYFGDIYICATSTIKKSGFLKSACMYPPTSEMMYQVSNKEINFYNGFKLDDIIYETKTGFVIFTIGYNVLMIFGIYILIKYSKLKKLIR